jgi:hypothetical protein
MGISSSMEAMNHIKALHHTLLLDRVGRTTHQLSDVLSLKANAGNGSGRPSWLPIAFNSTRQAFSVSSEWDVS